ncbi:isoprenylcysteine carboxylmethyltransferase family protein [candidate division KSB1 bacterium]|nr:isoprenylcysteine carboxylmethyltransferase family protein [candidate division KSB1 bacterium]
MTDKQKSLTPQIVIQLVFLIIGVPFLPLLISWRWDWWEGWVFALLHIFGFIISRLLAARRHPDIIAERARSMQHENTQSWDKILAPLTGLGGVLIALVAGLDKRFDLSPAFSTSAKMVSLMFFVAGFIIASYALIENRFFSGVVRIQRDRGHRVISSGPYRWIRHPGYAGALLTYLATPVFLDSGWTIIPVILITMILVIRTSLEDKTLQNQLAGYAEYAKRVRYRLLPGVW